MKNLVILQARMSSTRLPGKVLKIVNEKPMIEWQILRIKESNVKNIVLATSDDKSDDELAKVGTNLGINVFRGSLNDVHSRYFKILELYKPNYFLRLTGDCPMVMPELINEMIAEFESFEIEYLANTNPPSYPDGMDIEIILTESFLNFSRFTLTTEEKEHVTLGMLQRPEHFKIANYVNSKDLSKMRWTVDYEEDLNFVRNVFEYFRGRETHFTMNDILKALDTDNLLRNKVPHDFRNISLNKGAEIE